MSPSTVSIIVPNYNGRHHLGPCIESVFKGTSDTRRCELIVVDGASQDDSVEWLRTTHPGVRVVETPANLGFTGAIAAGVNASTGEALVFLNKDTRVGGDWLESLVGALDSAPESVATVTGKTLSWDSSRVDSRKGRLTSDGQAFQLDAGRPVAEVAGLDEPAELQFPCGANMVI